MKRIRHIIEVKNNNDPEQHIFEENELDEMLTFLRDLDDKNIVFSHQWTVVTEEEDG